MEIEVRLFANLAKLLPPGSQNKRAKMDVKEGATVDDLLNMLNVTQKITNIIMINGIQQGRETQLNEGDTVSIFPPIAGG